MYAAFCMFNNHKMSGECQLLADILYKEKVIPDAKWETYGHSESEIVRYLYGYIFSADEYSLANSGTINLLIHSCH